MTVAERAAELKQKSDEVKAAYAKMDEMGKDVDGPACGPRRRTSPTIRTELQKEIDDQTKAMKDGLARVLDTRVTAYAAEAGQQGRRRHPPGHAHADDRAERGQPARQDVGRIRRVRQGVCPGHQRGAIRNRTS